VINLIETLGQKFHFDQSDDVWTVFHSYAFDFSVWEIWTPLLHGHRLVIVPHWVTQSPEAFYALVQAEHVTVLNQTPSAIRQLIGAKSHWRAGGRYQEQAESDPSVPDKQWSVRLVICGGEALPQTLASKLLDWNIPLWNFYGPTEATVWTTVKEVVATDASYQSISRQEIKGGAVPIGRPLPNTQCYILDSHLDPVPVGVPGELYIGGAGLARGYLRRPELTAQKFIPHPVMGKVVEAGKDSGQRPSPTENTEATDATRQGQRLYKTGDLARYLPNGDLAFL
jgi:non-ribosomal peptide synthetase component F